MTHKCDRCIYKGEHQEMGFRPMGVCRKASSLVEATIAYEAKDCPYKKTNFDKIKEMRLEEMAEYLIDIGWDCHLCSEHKRLDNEPLLRGEKCDEQCVKHCLEWLKQGA